MFLFALFKDTRLYFCCCNFTVLLNNSNVCANAAFCFKSSLYFYTNSRRIFSASALARFILAADAIEDSFTSDNCSTNLSFFFLISELTFLKVSTHFVKLSIWSPQCWLYINILCILQNGDKRFCNRLQYLCLTVEYLLICDMTEL